MAKDDSKDPSKDDPKGDAKDPSKDDSKDAGAVQVRILLDHGKYKCNTVEIIDRGTAAFLVKSGIADAAPAAVRAALEAAK